MGTYIVQRGDTLSRIAASHGITLNELLAANPQFSTGGRNPNLIYPDEIVNIPEAGSSGPARPSSPTSGSTPTSTGGRSTTGCVSCTIRSQTVATSPSNRARTRIGVGEEVRLTVNPGPATWSITSGVGSLNPTRGRHTRVTFTASDTAGSVTITAAPSGCTCRITFTVVAPSNWTMTQQTGTNLKHTHGRPDCGWKGIGWYHPNDVNFYNIETRELDSRSIATGSYHPSHHNDWHGHYPPPERVSDWFPVVSYNTSRGSTDNAPDDIYSGYPNTAATGSAPPFNIGNYYWPITWQWRVGTGTARNFPVQRQEHQIFATGRCESRKGGNTEHTMYNDPTSSY